MSAIVQAYRERTGASAEIAARAAAVVAGGNSRQVAHWLPHPLTIAKAQGPRVFDLDGNAYLDLTNNYSALVHGHAYPPILEAIRRQAELGTAWSAHNAAQTELAELLAARTPSVAKIRFTNSGTEASNLALMIARTLTGRHKILMARFGYHGSLMETESGSFDHPSPLTYLGDYNDAASFEAVLEEHGGEIAAVFLEPVLGSAGIHAATPEFLRRVQAAARKAGALFVLDEVISFRMAEGGMQGRLGVQPDLTMFGKLIGGGLPVGAVGGSDEVMSIFDPSNLKAWHSGTYNGNPLTMAAGTVAVRELTGARIDRMAGLALRLKAKLEAAAAQAGLPLTVNQYGSLLNLFFSATSPKAAILREDQERIGRFHIAALNRGLFLATRGLIVLSTVMDEALIDEIGERAALAIADLAVELP